MLGKKPFEPINLKPANYQMIGLHCPLAYSRIQDMFWIICFVDMTLNPTDEALEVLTQRQQDWLMRLSLMNFEVM